MGRGKNSKLDSKNILFNAHFVDEQRRAKKELIERLGLDSFTERLNNGFPKIILPKSLKASFQIRELLFCPSCQQFDRTEGRAAEQYKEKFIGTSCQFHPSECDETMIGFKTWARTEEKFEAPFSNLVLADKIKCYSQTLQESWREIPPNIITYPANTKIDTSYFHVNPKGRAHLTWETSPKKGEEANKEFAWVFLDELMLEFK